MTTLQALREQLAALKKISYAKPAPKVAAGWSQR